MWPRTLVRLLAGCVVVCGLAWGIATAALYAVMRQPPEAFGAVMSHVPGVAMAVLPFVVYIQEAHPVDLWQMPSNTGDGVLISSPRTSAERADTAGICVVRLAIKIPALIDGIDNRIERAYTAWPDRLYIIGTDGRIRFKSAPGAFGFSTSDLEAALTRTLRASAVAG